MESQKSFAHLHKSSPFILIISLYSCLFNAKLSSSSNKSRSPTTTLIASIFLHLSPAHRFAVFPLLKPSYPPGALLGLRLICYLRQFSLISFSIDTNPTFFLSSILILSFLVCLHIQHSIFTTTFILCIR